MDYSSRPAGEIDIFEILRFPQNDEQKMLRYRISVATRLDRRLF